MIVQSQPRSSQARHGPESPVRYSAQDGKEVEWPHTCIPPPRRSSRLPGRASEEPLDMVEGFSQAVVYNHNGVHSFAPGLTLDSIVKCVVSDICRTLPRRQWYRESILPRPSRQRFFSLRHLSPTKLRAATAASTSRRFRRRPRRTSPRR